MPNDFHQSLEFYCLEVLRGCLAIYFLRDDTTKIQIMNEYGVMSSWTKSIAVSLRGIHHCYFFPICFTKVSDIVGEDSGTILVKYNRKGELPEHHDQQVHGCQVAMYIESLLSLLSDSGEGAIGNEIDEKD